MNEERESEKMRRIVLPDKTTPTHMNRDLRVAIRGSGSCVYGTTPCVYGVCTDVCTV